MVIVELGGAHFYFRSSLLTGGGGIWIHHLYKVKKKKNPPERCLCHNFSEELFKEAKHQ